MNNSDDAAALVAEQISVTRLQLGYDLEKAAAGARLDAQRLAEAEAGDVLLDEDELERLAGVYGVAVTAFFGGRVTEYKYLAGG